MTDLGLKISPLNEFLPPCDNASCKLAYIAAAEFGNSAAAKGDKNLSSCFPLAFLLLPSCYPLATLLLPSCYPLATPLLPSCYPLATPLLSTCFLLSTFFLPTILYLPKEYFPRNLLQIQNFQFSNFKFLRIASIYASSNLSPCYPLATPLLSACFLLPSLYLAYTQHIPLTYLGCTLDVPCRYFVFIKRTIRAIIIPYKSSAITKTIMNYEL